MPGRNVSISASYVMSHRLTVNNEVHGFYEQNKTIKLSAEEIEGKRFTYWSGNTNYVDNKYNPNITVKMPNGSIELTANYHNINENSSNGYVTISLYDSSTVNVEEIIATSNEIDTGFIITDSKGHIYVITEISNGVANITRLTKIQGGDESGQ